MKGEHSLRLLCEVLEVSRSGYYQWRADRPTAHARRDAELAALIAAAHRVGRGAYGAPRIVRELRDQGVRTSQRRCARLMRELGVKGKKRHARKPRTTDSRHGKKIAPNLLAQRPAPTGPNQTWVTDLTYVRTAEGWLYVSAILDLWSRRIVGWACSATMHVSLALAALNDAIRRRRPPRGVIHHSDRGSQYVDETYVAALEAAGFLRSMSSKGNCFHNAAMESFWSSFKTESDLEQTPPATRNDGNLVTFDYIETFYNRTRRHSSLDYTSPVAFELQHTNRKDIKAA
jgi:putative transposase